MICLQCGTENPNSGLTCVKCGRPLRSPDLVGKTTCFTHGNRESTTVCPNCGRPMCDECTSEYAGLFACPACRILPRNTEGEEQRIEHLPITDPAITEHANFASRLTAGLIDTAVIVIAGILLAVVVPLAFGTMLAGSHSGRSLSRLALFVYWLVLALLTMAYNVIFTTAEGQTLGKKAMRLAVVLEDGTSPTVTTALVRFAGSIVSLAALGMGDLVILQDSQRRAWHDSWAHTFVVSLGDTSVAETS